MLVEIVSFGATKIVFFPVSFLLSSSVGIYSASFLQVILSCLVGIQMFIYQEKMYLSVKNTGLQVVLDKLKYHFLVSKRQLKSSEGWSLCTYTAVYFDKEQGLNRRLVNDTLQLSLGKKSVRFIKP